MESVLVIANIKFYVPNFPKFATNTIINIANNPNINILSLIYVICGLM